jgi:two-component system, NarL family, invasion response regulator UvrY
MNEMAVGQGRRAQNTSGRKSMNTRVLIVDDHKMFRDGLRGLINAEPDLEVVGEAVDGKEAIEAARKLSPDIVIMDISMPGMNGIEAMRHLIQNNPKVKVIMLSMYTSGPLVQSVLAAGASGYVMKGSDFAELAATIRRVNE